MKTYQDWFHETLQKRLDHFGSVAKDVPDGEIGKILVEMVWETLREALGHAAFSQLEEVKISFPDENSPDLRVEWHGPNKLFDLEQPIKPPAFMRNLLDAALHPSEEGHREDQDSDDVLGGPSDLPQEAPGMGAGSEPAGDLRADAGGSQEEQPDLQGPDGPNTEGPPKG